LETQNPFPGLRPFEPHESHLFFGRERHVAEILRKLQDRRFVSIVGNSGSGKSSLVRAGVLPTLTNGDGEWLICVLRPGRDPVHQLASTLFEYNILKPKEGDSLESTIKEQYEVLKKNRLGLIQTVRSFIPENKKLLILVDQFEEIFRYNSIYAGKNEHEIGSNFVDLLLAGIDQKDVPIYVMMTLRSDYLGDCEQFMGLPEAINDGQFLIPRMNTDDLQLSLTGPVDYAHGKISPRLVQQLINEIGNNPDQLPILQHVLMRTWEVWSKEGLTEQPMDIKHYESTGGMNEALSRHAEEAFSELKTDRERRIAESLFRTITVKGPDNRGVRRPTTVLDIAKIARVEPDDIIDVAAHFRRRDRGFIMPPAGVDIDQTNILDISHESLMRVWHRLKVWVQEEADSAELYHRITESAILFEQERAGLWRDPDLQIAVDWRTRQDPNSNWAKQYNDNFSTATKFIEASENEKLFMVAEKLRRKRITNAAVIFFLISLSALSVWAVTERNNSEQFAQSAIAEKQEADKQKKLAEANFIKAKSEEERAQQQQLETEKQRKIALSSAEEAKIAELLAESKSEEALIAKNAAERDRSIAENQRLISDSLRYKSEEAEKRSNRLRILALSQNVAIKSKLADENTFSKDVKALLALQAYEFNEQNGGREMDAEIFGSLYSAARMYQDESEYIRRYHNDAVKSICYNNTTGDLVSAGDDGKMVISPKNGPNSNLLLKQQPYIYGNIVYSDNGKKIALSTDENSIQVFNSADISTPYKEIKGVHPAKIIAIEWFGENIITACQDNKIRVIDIASKSVTKEFESPSKPLSLDFKASTGRLVMGCVNGIIYSLNVNNDASFKLFKDLKVGQIKCLSINHNATMLAVGSSKGQCVIMSLKNAAVITKLSGHNAGISHVRFHPNKDYLATSCYDGNVRLFNVLQPGTQPVIFHEHSSWVMDVVFSPDGKTLASCGKDKTVRTYPIVPSELVKYLQNKVSRNLTQTEWNTYISSDVDYVKTIPKIP
jgi:WD40 repeat protein/energy-coupling factor transporter ATP-binding protein EcfA2